MRVVIVGGGIAAVYLANNLKKQNNYLEVTIISDEKYFSKSFEFMQKDKK